MTRHPSGGGVPSWPKRPPPTPARGGAVATAAALFDERRPPSGHGAPDSGRHPVSLRPCLHGACTACIDTC